jgi:hypothetical protein
VVFSDPEKAKDIVYDLHQYMSSWISHKFSNYVS